MLESERWVALRRLTDGESAPTHDLSLTWWQGARQEFDRSPSVAHLLATEPTPFWVAEFTVAGRSLFAEFDRLPDAPRSDLTLIGWPEIGGAVAVEADGQRVVALPLTQRRPHGLIPCP